MKDPAKWSSTCMPLKASPGSRPRKCPTSSSSSPRLELRVVRNATVIAGSLAGLHASACPQLLGPANGGSCRLGIAAFIPLKQSHSSIPWCLNVKVLWRVVGNDCEGLRGVLGVRGVTIDDSVMLRTLSMPPSVVDLEKLVRRSASSPDAIREQCLLSASRFWAIFLLAVSFCNKSFRASRTSCKCPFVNSPSHNRCDGSCVNASNQLSLVRMCTVHIPLVMTVLARFTGSGDNKALVPRSPMPLISFTLMPFTSKTTLDSFPSRHRESAISPWLIITSLAK
mmetsp:Transcript_29009/g.66660  ORF Transcript_29009/g.66660 Transcript_29009/m.66660 type:complete len:282 (-) Transcript_29009:2631-3476(-)